jgi:N-acetylglucosamine kinase-like BadF-type ATPase
VRRARQKCNPFVNQGGTMSRFDSLDDDAQWMGTGSGKPASSAPVAPSLPPESVKDALARTLAAVQAAAAAAMGKAGATIDNREARRLYVGNVPSGINPVRGILCGCTEQ